MSPDEADFPDEGYDEWLDAIAEGEGYYLECAEGHGLVPPRRVCPECGSTDLSEQPLSASGEVETFTTTFVASPSFEEDTPYVTAIVDFGAVQLTGQLRGLDSEDVETGLVVGANVDRRATTDDRLLVFRPR